MSDVQGWIEIGISVLSSVIACGLSIFTVYLKLINKLSDERTRYEVQLAKMQNDIKHMELEVIDLKKFIPDIRSTLHRLDKNIAEIQTKIGMQNDRKR